MPEKLPAKCQLHHLQGHDRRLRANSRLTVDDERPSRRAISAWLTPSSRQTAICSRSSNDKCR